MGIVSLGTGIPITAITLNSGPDGGSILATAVAWTGIAAVNAAHALRTRSRRR